MGISMLIARDYTGVGIYLPSMVDMGEWALGAWSDSRSFRYNQLYRPEDFTKCLYWIGVF